MLKLRSIYIIYLDICLLEFGARDHRKSKNFFITPFTNVIFKNYNLHITVFKLCWKSSTGVVNLLTNLTLLYIWLVLNFSLKTLQLVLNITQTRLLQLDNGVKQKLSEL